MSFQWAPSKLSDDFNSHVRRRKLLDDHRPCENLSITVFLGRFSVLAIFTQQLRLFSSREKFKITRALQLQGIFIIKIIQNQLKVNSVKVLVKRCHKVNLKNNT